jgi:tRNA (Thr-GGU) A37 N-methylase
MKYEVTFIGLVHSPHRQAEGTAIRSRWAQGSEGTVEVYPELAPGLRDLDGFERILWVLGAAVAITRFGHPGHEHNSVCPVAQNVFAVEALGNTTNRNSGRAPSFNL